MAIRKTAGGVGFRNNKIIFAGIAFLIVLVFVGALTLLKSIYQTETYYVLNNDVSTRTQITPDMLEPITTSAGTAPKAALDISDVQAGYLYTKYPLLKGDILTGSNVGGFEDISVGVPDEWVVTSFSVGADQAMGGRVRRGVYFDFMVVTPEGSFYPYVNVLALDTTVSLAGASSNQAVDTEEAHAGQTTQYVVGMPPDEAAKLQQIVKKYGGSINLVLSPRQNEYNKPQLSAYTGMFKYNDGDSPQNMGEGTDYTFTPVKRDGFGRPIEVVASCSEGNAKLSPEDCQKLGKTSDTTTNTPSTTPSASPSGSSSPTASPSATGNN